MNNDQILERLESLEALITKTEPDNPDDKVLFSDHTIMTQENIEWMKNIITGKTNHTSDTARSTIIQIMKDSNRIWGIRNKIHNGEWDDLKMLKVEDTIKDFLSQNQKVNAIKYYRKYMLDEFKCKMGLRQAKDTVDAVGEGRNVDLSIGYQYR
jgi:ribosomal protein L7/L12